MPFRTTGGIIRVHKINRDSHYTRESDHANNETKKLPKINGEMIVLLPALPDRNSSHQGFAAGVFMLYMEYRDGVQIIRKVFNMRLSMKFHIIFLSIIFTPLFSGCASRSLEPASQVSPKPDDPPAGTDDYFTWIQKLPPEYKDLVVNPSDCRASIPESISPDELAKDWAVVMRVIERAYAGFDYLTDKGIDWNEIFQTVSSEIADLKESIPTELLTDFFMNHLSHVPDSHMSFWIINRDSGAWTNYRSAGTMHQAFRTT